MVIITEIPLVGRELAESFRVLLPAIAKVVAVGLRRNPLPPMYSSGVVYQEEPQAGTGVEQWDTPWKAFERGWVDCDDAVIWRLAELYNQGVPATVNCVWVGSRFHVRIRHPNGRLEDPALAVKKPDTQLG